MSDCARRPRARVGGALSGAGRRAAGAGAGRAGGDPRRAAGAAAGGARAVLRVLRDLDEVLLPGRHPLAAPALLRLLRDQRLRAGDPRRAARGDAQLGRDPVADRAGGDRARGRRARLDGASCSGCPRGWHGHIEDTASTSTLAALIAAREATGRDLVVCSEQAHSSVEKAARMLGDASCARCRATTRSGCAPTQLGDLSDAARRRGDRRHDRDDVGRSGAGDRRRVRARPARGCTSTPPTPAPRWCAPSTAGRSTGVERADSLVVNAHKWMLTPMDCSLLWTRRPDDFRAAFSLVPEYLRTPDAEDALSLSEYGPALGRRFRALKLWAVLRCHGRSGLQAHIRSGVELAEHVRAVGRAPSRGGSCARRGRSRSCASGSRAPTSATASCSSASTRAARSSSPMRCSTGATCCGSRSGRCARPRTTSGAHGMCSGARRRPCEGRSVSRS